MVDVFTPFSNGVGYNDFDAVPTVGRITFYPAKLNVPHYKDLDTLEVYKPLKRQARLHQMTHFVTNFRNKKLGMIFLLILM